MHPSELDEIRATERIVRESRAAIERGDDIILPDWLAYGIADGKHPVRVVREHGKLLQLNVAFDAGISQGFLSEIEKGRWKLTPDVRSRLATALKVDPAWLEE